MQVPVREMPAQVALKVLYPSKTRSFSRVKKRETRISLTPTAGQATPFVQTRSSRAPPALVSPAVARSPSAAAAALLFGLTKGAVGLPFEKYQTGMPRPASLPRELQQQSPQLRQVSSALAATSLHDSPRWRAVVA